jgi:hypothetical protein
MENAQHKPSKNNASLWSGFADSMVHDHNLEFFKILNS